jgi:flagellar FliL protein
MPPPPKADSAKAEAKPEAAVVPIAAPAAAPRGGLMAWIPAIATVLLAPVATWATVEFVLLPRLQKKMSAGSPTEEHAAAETPAAESGGHGKGGKEGKEAGGANYEFQNVVVNLAGTMGTRYLKTSFLVYAPEPKTAADPKIDIKTIFEGAKPKLTDVTINVLSSLTLADLEEPGAKNVIREKLVLAYNQALGKKIADQVYFSDFVIQ